MRFQTSLEATIPMLRTSDQYSLQWEMHDSQVQTRRIPEIEQDEDRWRYGHISPGRDPVTEERG
jgi:hypothetical protein